jgi:lysophospholipase L1-like esterase
LPVLRPAGIRHRLILLVITAGIVAWPVLAAASPAGAQSSVSYVALGDSYASGVGAGDYISSSGSCDRSPNAYPALWAADNDPASYVSEACSGATTSTVVGGQLSALSSSTTLVSLTVGGNDVGFSSVMETCVIDFWSTSDCVNAVDSAEATANSVLPGRLDTLLGDIRADAPNAKVVIVGYPEFYDLSAPVCVGLSSGDHVALDQGADVLDGVLQAAAQRYGDSFADVRPYFAGHQLCDRAGWLNSVDLTDIDSSYHPTAAGQAGGYLPAFSAAAG